jgi:hypothetical protein
VRLMHLLISTCLLLRGVLALESAAETRILPSRSLYVKSKSPHLCHRMYALLSMFLKCALVRIKLHRCTNVRKLRKCDHAFQMI